jgi:hypothetical protein
MEKCIKLFVILSAAAAIAYAQVANTPVKQNVSPTTSGVVTVSSDGKKFIAHTAPTTKTNWSKVKDLFL